jgi:hypothetical protein
LEENKCLFIPLINALNMLVMRILLAFPSSRKFIGRIKQNFYSFRVNFYQDHIIKAILFKENLHKKGLPGGSP